MKSRKKNIKNGVYWDRIKRVSYMEMIFDNASALLDRSDKDPSALLAYEPKIRELEGYYESTLWRRDFKADEAGKLPKNMKRGILSEDCLYDFLESYHDVLKTIKKE